MYRYDTYNGFGEFSWEFMFVSGAAVSHFLHPLHFDSAFRSAEQLVVARSAQCLVFAVLVVIPYRLLPTLTALQRNKSQVISLASYVLALSGTPKVHLVVMGFLSVRGPPKDSSNCILLFLATSCSCDPGL